VAHWFEACINVVIVFPFGVEGGGCPQRPKPRWRAARRVRD
jgi:hypothetical protein